MPEAVHLRDLLLIWVWPGARFTPSPPEFKGPERAHQTAPEPLSGGTHSRGPCPSQRKDNSPWGSTSFSKDLFIYLFFFAESSIKLPKTNHKITNHIENMENYGRLYVPNT